MVGGDIAVVHYGVSAEDEGVCVYLCDDAGGGSADVGHDTGASGGGADGLEVRGMERRMGDFVEGGVEDGSAGDRGGGGRGELGFGGGVPGHAEAVDVEEDVAVGDFGLGCCAGVDFGVVGEEEGEVVVVDLFGDCVCWCWGDVRGWNWYEGRDIMPIRTSSRRHSSDGDMYANQRHIVRFEEVNCRLQLGVAKSIETCFCEI